MIHYEIKKIPEDFQVIEVNSFDMHSLENEKYDYHYYYVKKLGFTTFQAIEHIALRCGVPNQEIGYSGLKDEDGVTAQYVSSPQYITEDCINHFNNFFNEKDSRYITLEYVGSGDKPFKIAKLNGNHFQLNIRNLSKKTSTALNTLDEYHLSFINYYGSQRFGLPGQIKNTHLIGKAIFEENYKAAIIELSKQDSEHGRNAQFYHAQPEIFFLQLEKRMLAFFQNAYYSHLWNNHVIEQLKKINKQCVYEELDGIEYPLLSDEVDLSDLQKNCSQINNSRIVYEGDQFRNSVYKREIIVTTTIKVGSVVADDLNQGRYACKVSFYLPSGCYATIAIPQFMQKFITSEKETVYAELQAAI